MFLPTPALRVSWGLPTAAIPLQLKGPCEIQWPEEKGSKLPGRDVWVRRSPSAADRGRNGWRTELGEGTGVSWLHVPLAHLLPDELCMPTPSEPLPETPAWPKLHGVWVHFHLQ